jgi:hypothetical protein
MGETPMVLKDNWSLRPIRGLPAAAMNDRLECCGGYQRMPFAVQRIAGFQPLPVSTQVTLTIEARSIRDIDDRERFAHGGGFIGAGVMKSQPVVERRAAGF